MCILYFFTTNLCTCRGSYPIPLRMRLSVLTTFEKYTFLIFSFQVGQSILLHYDCVLRISGESEFIWERYVLDILIPNWCICLNIYLTPLRTWFNVITEIGKHLKKVHPPYSDNKLVHVLGFLTFSTTSAFNRVDVILKTFGKCTSLIFSQLVCARVVLFFLLHYERVLTWSQTIWRSLKNAQSWYSHNKLVHVFESFILLHFKRVWTWSRQTAKCLKKSYPWKKQLHLLERGSYFLTNEFEPATHQLPSTSFVLINVVLV